jgi:AraC family transcriptional regulator
VGACRSWGGLEAALVDTPAGLTRAAASANHRLGFHVGRPVQASCRFAGRAHRRLQSRGDVDLVPAGIQGTWEDDRSTRILRVQVTPALLGSTAEGMGLDPSRVELVPQYQLRDPLLQHVAWAFEADLESRAPCDPLYGESLAVALASRLLQRCRAPAGAVIDVPKPGHGLSPARLGRVTEYVEAHLDRPLSLAELAAVAGASTSHFKSQFRRSTGFAVHQYVVRRRVERARLLLLEGTGSLADVALQAGFSDQSHLARWTRRLLGVSPAAMLHHERG